ncbi:MAG TPA: GatB/YqeY domain-containing protein [Verrucomicrobiae bacterium]|nr:GatB/YqeY domain-containing protein [Verrucomicrobiae bacterium]
MILEQIDQDFKQALREKNEIALSSLRNLKSEIKNVEIDKQKPLTEDEVLTVVSKKVKQHKDSIESFTSGGRTDLVDHEQKQMEILQKYMPKQMDETEVRSVVKEVVALGGKEFGKVMKEVMGRLKGKADGGIVSKIVKEETA